MAKRPPLVRWVGGAVLLAVLIAALGLALWPQPVAVDLAVVERGLLTVTADGEGETRVKDVYVVTAPVGGYLLRIQAEVGDEVEAGETVLATIMPTDPGFLDARARARARSDVQRAEAALALAEAELRRARAELAFAKSELDRASHLAERGNVATAALDRAQMEVRTREAMVASAQAELNVRRSELEAARAALIEPGAQPGTGTGDGESTCCVQVRSPHDGVILRIVRESEGVVAAGEPVMEVGHPSELEVVVDLLSSDAVKVKAGDKVLLEDWGGDETLEGRVRRVEPFGFTEVSALGIDEQRVNVLIDITSPREQWESLGHGYRIMAKIVTWQGDDVLSVPIGAVFRPAAAAGAETVADTWAVFVVDDGRAKLREVSVGRFTDRRVEVTSGLEPGEAIILHPSDQIEERVPVIQRMLEPA